MADRIDKAARSKNMRSIRSKDTKPEMIVRKLVYGMGYRYRLHRKDLPGTPDLAFRPSRKVIFVHGCFWHQHSVPHCRDGQLPRSNKDYWLPKLQRNVERDQRVRTELRRMGWGALVIWECETRDLHKLAKRIGRFLGGRLAMQQDKTPTEKAPR